MIKRKKIVLFLCLAISMLNISKVYGTATTITIIGEDDNSSSGDGPGGNGGSGGNGQYSAWTYFKEDSKRIKYRYSIQTGSNSNYNINYDSPNGDTIKAGTWMGISIHEIQSASWNVSDIEYKEIKRVYTCTMQIPSKQDCECYMTYNYMRHIWVCPGEAGYNEKHCKYTSSSTVDVIKNEEHDYYDSFSCPAGTTMKVEEKETDIDDIASKTQEVYNLAHNRAASMVGAPFSKLQIITDELNEKNEHKTEIILGSLVSSSDSGAEKSGTVTKTYSYKPSSICINLKTGKVRDRKSVV